MTSMRFDPFSELDPLANQAVGDAWTAHTLPVEALRRGDQFVIAVDVPGITENDLDVTVERNVVEVSARRQPLRQEGDQMIVDEQPQGGFRRQLFLGENLDPSKMTGQVDHGVLTLAVPVSEASKPRKIAIGAAKRGEQAIPATSESQQTVNAQVRSSLIPRRGPRRSNLTSRYAKWPSTAGYWAKSKLGDILPAPRGEPHIEVSTQTQLAAV